MAGPGGCGSGRFSPQDHGSPSPRLEGAGTQRAGPDDVSGHGEVRDDIAPLQMVLQSLSQRRQPAVALFRTRAACLADREQAGEPSGEQPGQTLREAGDQLRHRRFGYHLRGRIGQPGADAGSVLTRLEEHRVCRRPGHRR